MRQVRSKPRVLLDANVWRYFVDANADYRLRQASIATKVEVAVAPAVLYESFRVSDAALRARLVSLLTHGLWHRLMPEAYDESLELLEEIRRLRPEWLARKPNRDAFVRLRRDWQRDKRGFWDRAQKDHDTEAARVLELEADMLSTARTHAREARTRFSEGGWRYESIDLRKVVVQQVDATGKSVGYMAEPWRLASHFYYTKALMSCVGAHYDWLASNVDLARALEEPGWKSFWLHETEVTRMPRAWMRWACELLFALRKVTPGTPCDIQLATYLVGVSHFITSDRVFADILSKCRESAPVDLAAVFLVPGGGECIDAVLDIFQSLAEDRSRKKARPRAE